jgi:chorismate mutase/prephenate dehydratase
LTNYDVRHCHKWAQLLLERHEKINQAVEAAEKGDFDSAKKLLSQIVNGAYSKQVDPGMMGSLLYHMAMVTKMESETRVILKELKIPQPNISLLLNKLYGEFEADAKELLKDTIFVIFGAEEIAKSKRLTSPEKIVLVTNLKAETKKVEAMLTSKDPKAAGAMEKKIISRVIKNNPGPLSSAALESVYREVLNACRSLESRLTVAYFGPEATFTHQAALKNFGSLASYVPFKSIADVFTEVEKHRVDYGVVPIENSTEGVVNHTLDMFIEADLVICAEISMPIEQCLLSRSGDKKTIRKVYSHPHALPQCRNWLEANLPGVAVIEISSTAEAAKKAAGEPSAAAIASRAAATLYNLEIVARGIEDNRENYTRFLVIGRNPAERSGQDKTSVLFSIKDKVGALHDILMSFKSCGINLTKIESRPTKKRAWEYIFFVDFLGHISETKVQTALRQLARHSVFVKVLGSYPRAD